MKSLRPRWLLFALHELSWDLLTRLDRHTPRRAGPGLVRLWLEPLEDRTLLSVSISGTIFNDLHDSGVRTPDDPTVPGAMVFLDAKGTGQLAQQSSFTYAQNTPSLINEDPNAHTDGGFVFAESTPINVAGLSSTFTDFTVSLNVSKNQPGSIAVALASPAGIVYGLGPLLLVLEGGYVGTVHKSSGYRGTSTPTSNTGVNHYTGTNVDTFTFTVLQGGTVGTDNIQLAFTDSTGANSGTLTVPSGYTGGLLSVAQGVQVKFSSGSLVTGNQFTITGYEASFSGTFDDNAASGLAAANPFQSPTAVVSPIAPGGTYKLTTANGGPFAAPINDIYNGTGNPDGAWQLLFLDNVLFTGSDNSSNYHGLQLNSWSISFTGSDLSTTTDANGNYSFDDLVPGNYQVTVQNNQAGHNPSLSVPYNGSHAQTGQNIGIPLHPDLVGTSFQVASSGSTNWGDQVLVDYTITNRGAGDAGPSNFDIWLTSTGKLDTTAPGSDGELLLTATPVVIPAVNAGQSVSGQVMIQLPGAPGMPPTGYSAVDAAFLNLQIDPAGLLTETDGANNANQGQGLDLAPVVTPGNQLLSTGSGTQQDPSVAVDPDHPNHVAVAYMDYALMTDGYAGIEVADSTQGGESGTWTYSKVPLPSFNASGGSLAAGYPVAQFDNQGNLAVSFMAADFLGTQAAGTLPPEIFPEDLDTVANRQNAMLSDNGIYVAKASEGKSGLVWSAPVAVDTPNKSSGQKVPFDAMPDMVADAGYLFVTWTRYYPAGLLPKPAKPNPVGGTDIFLAVSPDAGTTWYPSTNAQGVSLLRESPTVNGSSPSTGDQQFAHVTFDNNTGNVTISYFFQPTDEFHIVTTGDGVHFTAHVSVLPGANEGAGPAIPNFNDQDPAQAFYNPAFRNVPVRDVVADPSRPGTLYAVEAVATEALFGSTVKDPAEIDFARSSDGGQTWESIFTVGNSYGNLDSFTDTDLNALGQQGINAIRSSLNDDNGGNYLALTSGSDLANQAVALQAAPRIFVDSNGDIIVVWYDTRRDPSNNLVDVYATLSTDGGQSFSPNFRLTDVAFNPLTGGFYDPSTGNNDNYFLGDFLGLAAAGGIGYAAWTDTNTAGGQQGIFFTRFVYEAPQPAPADRFDPDSTPATAANLGTLSGRQAFPRLALNPGSADFYRLTPMATGSLTVTLSASQALNLQLFDSTGQQQLAQGTVLFDQNGNVIGAQLVAPVSGQTPILIEVNGVPVETAQVAYTMTVEALTANLGTVVTTTVTQTNPENVAANDSAIYALTAPVSGSFEIDLTALGLGGPPVFNGGTLPPQSISFTVYDATGATVLASGQPSGSSGSNSTTTAIVPVSAGQVILVLVAAANGTTLGNFSLAVSSRDQFQTPKQTSLFFPIPGSPPVALAVGKLTGGNTLDIVAANTDLANPISVLLNDGNGTGLFGAPQTFNAGTGSSNLPGGGARSLVLDSFTSAGQLDVAMTNFQSGDVSVLLNNGNGTLGSDRRSDALQYPGSVLTADFNGDNQQDLVVLPETTVTGQSPEVAVLLGRGDGTFVPPLLLATDLPSGTVYGAVGDFTGNGNIDIAVFSATAPEYDIFLGDGHGHFTRLARATVPNSARAVVAADFNDDGKDDLAVGSAGTGTLFVLLSQGDGTFQLAQSLVVNTDPAKESSSVIGLAIGDLGGPGASDTSQLGPQTGKNDLVAIVLPLLGGGPTQLNVLSLNPAAPGQFKGFANPTQLATGDFNGAVATGDFRNNNLTDIAVVDGDSVRVIYNGGVNVTPNKTAGTARNLGDALHVLTPTEVIAPNFEDAYFTYTVPTESAAGAGNEVIDFSAIFGNLSAPGLQMEILGTGAATNPTGTDIRLVVPQGTVLTVHIFGVDGASGARGAGTFALDIDVLPQVVQVAAQALEVDSKGQPTGPINSLVITFQGDQLQQLAAETVTNYQVTLVSPSGDQRITDLLSVVLDTGADTQIASGRAFASTIEQTVTLIFASPLAPGSYRVDLSPALQSVPFTTDEADLLSGGHSLVSVMSGQINIGATATVVVPAGSQAADFSTFTEGTPFLTNLHDDLGAVLNSQVTAVGSQPNEGTVVTQALLNQIIARFAPIAGAPGQAVNYLVLVLDPVGIDLDAGTRGGRAQYSLQSANSLQATTNNTIARSYWDVGGNVEVLVLAAALGNYSLNLSDISAGSRGAAVIFDNGTLTAASLTDAMRAGQDRFDFFVPAAAGAAARGQQPASSPGVPTATISPTGADAASSFFFTGLPEPGTYGVGDQIAVSLLLTVIELTGGPILTAGVSYDGGTAIAPSGVGENQPRPNDDANNANPNPNADANPNANPPNPNQNGNPNQNPPPNPNQDGNPNQNPPANPNQNGNPNQNPPPNPNQNQLPVPNPNGNNAQPPAKTEQLTLEMVTPVFQASEQTALADPLAESAAQPEFSQDGAVVDGADQLDPCLAAAVFTAGLCQSWLGDHSKSESHSSRSRWRKE
jgi:hypothetical protein